jgi:hypothetical protein
VRLALTPNAVILRFTNSIPPDAAGGLGSHAPEVIDGRMERPFGEVTCRTNLYLYCTWSRDRDLLSTDVSPSDNVSTAAAFEAIKATLPMGASWSEPALDEKGRAPDLAGAACPQQAVRGVTCSRGDRV